MNLRNSLSKIKDGAYVINFDEYKSIGSHWIALYVDGNNVILWQHWSWTYFKRNKKLIGNKNMITIYRIQVYDLIMCG